MRKTAVVLAGALVLGWWGSQSGDPADEARRAGAPTAPQVTPAPTPQPPGEGTSEGDAGRQDGRAEAAPRPRAGVRTDVDARRPETRRIPRGGRWAVLDVVDGDTVEVDYRGSEVSVRVIGIDTPETVHPSEPVECGGPQASAAATRMLSGKHVRLVFDPSQGRTDSYGRTLAYLQVPGLGDFGRAMIRHGRAAEYTYDTAYAHQARYLAAQSNAQAGDRGIWDRCGGVDTPLFSAQPAPASEPRQTRPAGGDCNPGYDPCVPPYPPDLDCGDVDGPIRVTGDDPHGFDADGDGIGCDS